MRSLPLFSLSVILVLALPASPAQGTSRGENTLALGTASGAVGSDVTVPLSLANADAVRGLQLDVLYDAARVSFATAAVTARTAQMSIQTSTPASGRLRVLMYYSGDAEIAAGTGAIAQLTFHLDAAGLSALTPESAELSDPDGQELEVTATAGSITVTGGTDPSGACCATDGSCALTTQTACSAGVWQGAGTSCTPNPCSPATEVDTLSVGTVSGVSGATVTVPLRLRNTQPVAGAQLDLRFDPAVVSFTSAAITSRATGASIPPSTPSPGRLLLLIYFSGGGSIAAGDGAVANLTFQIIGAAGTQSDLTPAAATLSDPDAQPLAVVAVAGRITVTGGGDPTGACCAATGSCSVVTEVGCLAGTWQGAGTSCTPNPCPAAPAPDTLAIAGGSGAPGEQITISLALANHAAVRGIQAEIRADSTVLRFESGTVTSRVGNMVLGTSAPAANRTRILMYYDTEGGVLAAGRGAVANLVFRIVGGAGSQTALTLTDIGVADANNQPVEAVGMGGEVSVVGAPQPPDLRLAVLQNPGRTRTMQIFLSSDLELDALPTVVLSGGTAVVMSRLSGLNLYQGSASVDEGTASVTVLATGMHLGAAGATQTTVTF